MLEGSNAEFPNLLREVVDRIVRAELQKRNEEYEIKATMRRLGMIGESATMLSVFRSVIRFSSLSGLPVLITGETGTGKEGLARALHRLALYPVDPKSRKPSAIPRMPIRPIYIQLKETIEARPRSQP